MRVFMSLSSMHHSNFFCATDSITGGQSTPRQFGWLMRETLSRDKAAHYYFRVIVPCETRPAGVVSLQPVVISFIMSFDQLDYFGNTRRYYSKSRNTQKAALSCGCPFGRSMNATMTSFRRAGCLRG